jgi:hypothetical protein
MNIVIASGTLIIIFFYVIIGVFAYATFSIQESLLCSKNILEADGYNKLFPI